MKKIILIIFTVLLLTGFQTVNQNTSTDINDQEVAQAIKEIVENQITYQCPEGKSAFQALQDSVGEANVVVKEFSFGKQVTAINQIEQGNNKFWLYTINQQEATTSADTYICQGDEKIVWELK